MGDTLIDWETLLASILAKLEQCQRIEAKNKQLRETLRESARRFERMGKTHYEIDMVLSEP